jgi:hypothetical protein
MLITLATRAGIRAPIKTAAYEWEMCARNTKLRLAR